MTPKIMLVETDATGGLVHFAYQMATALTATGANVTLVTARHYELEALPHTFTVDASLRLWDATAAEPAWVARLPSPLRAIRHKVRRVRRAIRYVATWEQLTRRILKARPDVVQFSIIRFPFQVWFLRRIRRAGITVTQVCHEFEHREDGGLWRSINRRLSRDLYREFDAIFFLGHRVRDEFHDHFPVDRATTHVIPHGDESLFLGAVDGGGDLRRAYGLDPEAPVAVFFGGLRPSKGIEDLVAAFAAVVAELPDANLVIAGLPTADVDPDDFRRHAASLGIGDAVTVDDRYLPIEDVGRLVRTGDVVVLPYRSGTASGALQVAYAFERPVITTSVGSVSEAVVNGETGFVVPPSDRDALARATIKVLADRAEARRMGSNGRAHAAKHHGWTPIAQQVLQVSLGQEDAS